MLLPGGLPYSLYPTTNRNRHKAQNKNKTAKFKRNAVVPSMRFAENSLRPPLPSATHNRLPPTLPPPPRANYNYDCSKQRATSTRGTVRQSKTAAIHQKNGRTLPCQPSSHSNSRGTFSPTNLTHFFGFHAKQARKTPSRKPAPPTTHPPHPPPTLPFYGTTRLRALHKSSL